MKQENEWDERNKTQKSTKRMQGKKMEKEERKRRREHVKEGKKVERYLQLPLY